MRTVVLAEAGLSECARYDVCPEPQIGTWLAMWAGGLLLAMVWLTVSLYATVHIVTSGIRASRAALWLVAVWFLPLIGAIAWFRRPAGRTQ